MNLNPKFKDFEKEIGIEVEQDEYSGTNGIYFVFQYEDERGTLFGDNKPLEDTCYIQLKLYTPKDFNYFELKKMTRDYFESSGFFISSIFTYLEKVTINAEKMRCTVFKLEYTDEH